jgi:hypothetical protein
MSRRKPRIVEDKELQLIKLCFSGHFQDKPYNSINTDGLNDLFFTIQELRKERNELLAALEGIVEGTTVEFSEKWGFGPQRMKASEVYDQVKWGTPKAGGSGE